MEASPKPLNGHVVFVLMEVQEFQEVLLPNLWILLKRVDVITDKLDFRPAARVNNDNIITYWRGQGKGQGKGQGEVMERSWRGQGGAARGRQCS